MTTQTPTQPTPGPATLPGRIVRADEVAATHAQVGQRRDLDELRGLKLYSVDALHGGVIAVATAPDLAERIVVAWNHAQGVRTQYMRAAPPLIELKARQHEASRALRAAQRLVRANVDREIGCGDPDRGGDWLRVQSLLAQLQGVL